MSPPCQEDEIHGRGHSPPTQPFQNQSSSRDSSSLARLEPGLGLRQKPIRLANIPLCSLRWLSRQGVSRHLLSQHVSSLGEKNIHMSQAITSNINGVMASAILLSSSLIPAADREEGG